MHSYSNRRLKNEILTLVRRFYPQIDLRIIFNNTSTIASFFKYKDKVPAHVRSNVVYKYQCPQCEDAYIGETTRHLTTRIAEHRGVSARTGNVLRTEPKSNIYSHFLNTGHDISPNSFTILYSDTMHLKIAESILIHQHKPKLNSMTSSVPLRIIGT